MKVDEDHGYKYWILLHASPSLPNPPQKIPLLIVNPAWRSYTDDCSKTNMGDKFERDYEALTGSKLAEPQNEEDVEKILSFLRMRNGFLDAQDRAELQQSSVGMQQRLLFHAENSREVLASYTTA